MRQSRSRADARVAAVRALLDTGGPRTDGGAALTASLEGEARGAPLKCLHAHAAAALAAPPYAFGRLVLERAEPEHEESCCAWA